MQIKSLVTGAALALAFSVGSASAAEDFSAMSAVPAAPLTASEMAAVTGAYIANARPPALGAPFNVLEFLCKKAKNPGGR